MAGVLSRPVDDPVLVPKKPPGILSRIAAMPNPGYLVSQGVDRITTPGYPVDDALRGYMGSAPAFQPTLGQAASAWRDEGLGQSSEFLTALQRGDMDAVMNSSLFPMGAMTAYHGSPHKFDAFDLSKIGTGEGAQAYGHGLYFAENPGVAGSYAENLAKDPRDELTGLLKDLRNPLSGYVTATKGEIAEALSKHPILGPIVAANPSIADEARKIAYGMNKDGTVTSEAMKAFGRLEKVLPPPSKNLYHVDIPDDEIAKMLDWDKPLSEQRPEAQKVLRGMLSKARKSFGQIDPDGNPIAGQVYHLYQQHRGGNAAAVSDELKAAGIPGIKYLDGGSRGAGEGSRNIVLFDDKIPKIIKRE